MAYISFQPSDHFNTKLWTGNSTNSTAITGVGFQPDMVWIKNRSTTDNHAIFDAIRGATYRIYPNATDAQIQATNSLASFDSDGFTLNDGGDANGNGENIVGWNWKANGQGSSNTDGSINTTYTSANTTSGVSISTYSGTGSAATIGHGLGAIPQVMIVKNTYQAEHWIVYHHKSNATPEDYYLRLNDTTASSDFPMWNDTAPTSSVFSVGTSTSVNQAGGTFVAYCFAEKKGFSKFGSYTGNGNADGPFLYCGFKPAFIMIKRTNTTGDWLMKDNKRPTVQNPVTSLLYPNTSGAEATGVNDADFLSNGYKIRTTGTAENASGGSYIYMAFAEEPLVSSNGVPAVAR